MPQLHTLNRDQVGSQIYDLAARIFPICRSITGDGVRETLRLLREHVPFELHELPTGAPIFDWVVPREWSIRDAYIKDSSGNKVVDFAESNLHVVNYSIPVNRRLTLSELRNHLHTLPDQPDAIPYRTSYYHDDWGFCLSHNRMLSLRDDTYDVHIDSDHKEGFLTYGEYVHKGEMADEFLISSHICHPSLANDNCSGVALTTQLAKQLMNRKTRFTYRFLLAPGTIGAIAWLANNREHVDHIKYGLVLAMVGDGGGPTYKKSRRGDTEIDRAVAHVLCHSGLDPRIISFSPYGYDERQFCSPGFNLPVGLFQRSAYASIPEYHTSNDNLSSIGANHLGTSYELISEIIELVEANAVFQNTSPYCEPQLGKRGLYTKIGGDEAPPDRMAMLWVLNLSDGRHSLLDIAERAGLPFSSINRAASALHEQGLLSEMASKGAFNVGP